MTLLADVVSASKAVTEAPSRSLKVTILADLLRRHDRGAYCGRLSHQGTKTGGRRRLYTKV